MTPGVTVSHARNALFFASAGVPACVLLLAGVAKLCDPFLAGLFIHSTMYLPLPAAFVLARVLAVGELAVGATLIACAGFSVLPAFVAVGLYTIFVGLLVRLIVSFPNAASCGCFGDLFSGAGQHHLSAQCALDVFMATLLVIHILLRARHARVGAAPGAPRKADACRQHGR